MDYGVCCLLMTVFYSPVSPEVEREHENAWGQFFTFMLVNKNSGQLQNSTNTYERERIYRGECPSNRRSD